ncbi:MAG: terpene cyclase/mutase family protein [Acidobacteria bacterium]|nr:terpene cyclase/mutase family protein [Acidobacteriota bacterium]
MPGTYRKERLDALLAAQNDDGGWGYFAGKKSWLEPTVYSLLALHASTDDSRWNRGWNLVRSWQLPDGSWRANALTAEPHWSTALAITLHCVRQEFDQSFHKGVQWLLSTTGEESTALSRFVGLFVENHLGHDRKFAGWPWVPGTTAWIEPTSHSLVALKKAAPHVNSGELRRRIVLAEGMILRRRCADGGWNYGSREALGIHLPSYPETTGLALLGLQSCPEAELSQDIARAMSLLGQTQSRLGRAWLGISLRNLGQNLPEDTRPLYPRDVLSTSLEALASPGGGHALLRPAALPA